MKNADNPNAWLLVKKADEFATTEDVTKQDQSVVSGKRVDDLGGKIPDLKITHKSQALANQTHALHARRRTV
jgi:hypothetical protein